MRYDWTMNASNPIYFYDFNPNEVLYDSHFDIHDNRPIPRFNEEWPDREQSKIITSLWKRTADAKPVMDLEDGYLGWEIKDFLLMKIFMSNPKWDRCVIKSAINPECFTVFDLKTYGFSAAYHVLKIVHYSLSPEDEMLIRLSV